ncbi:MAG: Aldehyde:ferredoxin oxidoreductase [Candidatus Alkanophagales archaeon MCA70_species_2]|nr:Aldehyde:ferredoxin oxidoreductase [Candidatus Alkanophaga liquidiphilum]
MENYGGWSFKILDVNLSNENIKKKKLDVETARKFLGGRGLGVKILCDASRKHGIFGALSDKNPLVFAVGPLTGLAPMSGRHVVISKSPLTGTVFDSSAGGFFGVELKFAGYDAVIVRGRAERLVYLEIEDEHCEIRDAEFLKGKNIAETTAALSRDGSRVACIGRSGERLVKFANIMSDMRHACGRGGLGAVMGFKNLKALVVRASRERKAWWKQNGVADAEKFKEAREEVMRLLRASPVLKALSYYGTAALVNLVNYMRIMPTFNFRRSFFEAAENLSGETIREKYELRSRSCYGCFVACKHFTKAGVKIPEYETLWAFGPDCGNYDLEKVIKANELCDDYGIDTISCGGTLACYFELIGRFDATDANAGKNTGVDIVQLVKSVGEREGVGAELAEGSLRLATKYGKKEVSMSVKGLELPGYDPRGVFGQALAYATSNRGGCHLRAYMVSPEIIGKPKLVNRLTFDGKAALVIIFQNLAAAIDSFVLCKFSSFALSEEEYAKLLSAVTASDYKAEDVLNIGERIWGLERMFNLKHLRRLEDTLPRRFFESLDERAFKKALQEYYHLRGWGADGIPTTGS